MMMTFSIFCKTLSRSVFQGGSYLDKSDVKEFGVGYGIFSHTNETVWKVGRYLLRELKERKYSIECYKVVRRPN